MAGIAEPGQTNVMTSTAAEHASVPFFKVLGQLPSTWWTLAVAVMAGLCEGFGLVLFVPLLEILDGGGAGTGKGTAIAQSFFNAVNLPMNVFTMLSVIVILIVASLAIVFGKDLMLARAKYRHLEGLRGGIIGSLFLSRWDHMSRQASGEVINQLLMECYRSSSALTYQVMAVAVAIQVAIFAVISALLSWKLLVLCMALGAVVVWAIRPLNRRARSIGEATNVANRDYGFHVVDYLRGARLVRVSGSEERVLRRLKRLNRAFIDVSMATEVITHLTYFVVQAIPVVILGTVIALSHGILGVPTSVLLTFLLIMARMAPRLTQLQQHYQAYSIYAPAIPSVDGAIAAGRAATEDRRTAGRPFERLEEALELEDVTFRYEDESEGAAVEAISLSIPRNTMTAVVGGSGAGKSTLIDLIAGLRVPDSGRITIDGVDLGGIDLLSWRRHIGYVTQDVTIFNDSLRNNLTFVHPEAGEADIQRVLELTHLTEFVATLQDGMETVLGEGGVRLSGGQKQRLALARALIGDPQLLLLDEATSALDNESERLIQKALESIAHRLTIVVVAHRLATARRADRIFVMEGGRIVESGTFDELLARDGRFFQLHDVQFS